MAIASDPTLTAASAASVGSITILNVPVAATPYAAIGVRVHLRSTAVTVTSVSWGGKALLRHSLITGTNNRQEKWYAVGLTPGTNNVVVTLSANSVVVAAATVRYNVDQTSPLGNAFTASGNSTAPSVNVTSADPLTDLLVCDGMSAQASSATNPVVTAGAGQTQEYSLRSTSGPPYVGDICGAGSRRAFAGNPQTMSWTLSTAEFWTMIGTYWRPARLRISFSWAGLSSFSIPMRPVDPELVGWRRLVDAELQRLRYRLRD